MTNLSIVAIGVILIAFVVYLAIEQRGQDIVWYQQTGGMPPVIRNLGDADGYELHSANALVTVTGAVAADPARPGEDRATYTLDAVDQSPNYRLNNSGNIRSTSQHVLDFDDGMCINQTLAGTPASLRLTTRFDPAASGCAFAPAAHGEHDTAFYFNGTSAGDATGVDITSGNTALLTVGGASVSADTLRPGQNRMTYTLNAVDQSPRYRLNGGSTTQATHGHALDFVDGTCMTNALAGDGAGGVRLTSNFNVAKVGCTAAPAAHTHPTILHLWTFGCGGTPSGDPLEICDFEIESGVQESGMATTRDTYRNSDDDLQFRRTGNYLLDFRLELRFNAPGALVAGAGTCASGTRTESTAPAVAPSPLQIRTPPYSPDFVDRNMTPMPAGNWYCETTSGNTIPNLATDVALQFDVRQMGPYSFSLRDDDPEILIEESVTVTRDTSTIAGGYHPHPTFPVADVTEVTSVGDVLEFQLYELDTGDYMLDRTRTKLHLLILRLQ